MKFTMFNCCVVATLGALASAFRPAPLPPSPWADTEVTTNLTFASTLPDEEVRDFRVAMSFLASPSNNVQLAFGRDADGDGALSVEETDLTLGWDCGFWVARAVVAGGGGDERVEERRCAFATTNERKDFSWTLRMFRGVPRALVATENGEAVFANLGAPLPSWVYSRDWNLLRVTARGVDEANARLEVAVRPWGLVIRLR